MEFLVQYAIEGSEKIINKIVNSCWIIKATNESDFNGIEEMHVFDVTDLGKIKPLHYREYRNIEILFCLGLVEVRHMP